MPLRNVHFLLARIPLCRWSREPAHAPFDVGDPIARNAYFQGALGPDMGWFPGGEPILSELAHTVQADELTRTLVATARTEVQRAFAWGWVTHMVADDVLHPVIDRCAARLVAADGDDATDPALLAAAHARVEMGLDVVVHQRDAELRALRLRPCFNALSIRYVAAAYRATYGLSFNPRWVLRSHRAVAPLAAALGLLQRLHTRAAPERADGRSARRALHWIRRIFAGRLSTQSAAFLHPVYPTVPLLGALAALQHRFADPDPGLALLFELQALYQLVVMTNGNCALEWKCLRVKSLCSRVLP